MTQQQSFFVQQTLISFMVLCSSKFKLFYSSCSLFFGGKSRFKRRKTELEQVEIHSDNTRFLTRNYKGLFYFSLCTVVPPNSRLTGARKTLKLGISRGYFKPEKIAN